MPLRSIGRAFSQFAAKVKDVLVQDIPPELHACEICQKVACSHGEWEHCEKRLAAAQFLKTGNEEAIEHLRKRHRAETTGEIEHRTS